MHLQHSAFFLNLYDAEGLRRLRIHLFQNAWVRASIPLVHFQKRNTKGNDMAAIGKTALPGLWIGFTGSVGSINQIVFTRRSNAVAH